ncbi:phosphatidate cytidylyltransferase [Novosphingobium sp. 9]|uniref:phosphatidate cytidylyltransferase n=1 Tax=Novosphingobium sp. 9 TaxID=2025349 RepID=UPI0021B6029E|nr:phosphatidate cytidylyltransferase [Novosphingobium sp. 9]
MADAERISAKVEGRKSDLKVRTLSAIVMLAIAGSALWLGGLFWRGFVIAVAAGVFWEWVRLVHAITPSPVKRGLWNAAGIIYVIIAAATLALLRDAPMGAMAVLVLLGLVIATDVGAYFSGRTFGGPKIAPRISPSKTWAGLIGGMVLAGAVMVASFWWAGYPLGAAVVGAALLEGALAAVVAQAGDFFESWMKRRAGVKDSSGLIPGHGGLFDRVDGLLALCFVLGLYFSALRAGGYL